MFFKGIIKTNYFVALLILLGIIIVLIVTAFGLTTTLPGPLGVAPFQLEVKEIYEFEPWTFAVDELVVTFPEGGIIVPGYKDEKQEAVLLIGEGRYQAPKGVAMPRRAKGLYLMINQELFEEKRGDTIFVPVEDWKIRNEALQLFSEQPGLPVIWRSGIPLVFIPHGQSAYYYFLDASGKPSMPPVSLTTPWGIYGTALVYALMILIAILTMLVFSLDYKPSRYWLSMHSSRPGLISTAAALGAALLALGSELLPVLKDWPDYSIVAGYGLAVLVLLILAWSKRIDFLNFGIRLTTVKNGYLSAFAAIAILILLTRGIPRFFTLESTASALKLFVPLFMLALVREGIWRGYIQTTFSRSLGPGAAILLTAALAGLVHYVVLRTGSPWMMQYPYTLIETAVLVPGSALLLGFLYQRTENILSCALLHSLIIFLPMAIL